MTSWKILGVKTICLKILYKQGKFHIPTINITCFSGGRWNQLPRYKSPKEPRFNRVTLRNTSKHLDIYIYVFKAIYQPMPLLHKYSAELCSNKNTVYYIRIYKYTSSLYELLDEYFHSNEHVLHEKHKYIRLCMPRLWLLTIQSSSSI